MLLFGWFTQTELNELNQKKLWQQPLTCCVTSTKLLVIRRYFTDLSHWSFEEFKDYFESGIDDAVDVATRTFFGKRDMDGNPEILHALTVGMAGKTKYEKIVGFQHDVVEDSDTTLDNLRTYGYSDEVIDALALLTHDKKAKRMLLRRNVNSVNVSQVLS